MAPEQVEGHPPDARTDLWALGAILYEMLTGKPAFEADSVVGLMDAIRGREPVEIAVLRPPTPPALDRLVRKCLAKDPDARWQTAADVADELRWLAGGSGATVISGESHARPRSRRAAWQAGALLLAAFCGVVLGGLLWRWLVASPASSLSVERFQVTLADTGLANPNAWRSLPTVGPSSLWPTTGLNRGCTFAVVVTGQSRPLDGTEGALRLLLLPDGLSVNFLTANGLHRVPVGGGAPVVIEPDEEGRGMREGLRRHRLRRGRLRRPLAHHGIAAVADLAGWWAPRGARSTGRVGGRRPVQLSATVARRQAVISHEDRGRPVRGCRLLASDSPHDRCGRQRG